MKKLLFVVVAISSLPLISCTGPESEFSPRGPVSDKSDQSWNRPFGPEGGGALGGLLQ